MEHKDWVDELAAQLGNGGTEVPLVILYDTFDERQMSSSTRDIELEITDVRLEDGKIKMTVMRV